MCDSIKVLLLLLAQVADGPWETDELIADERYAAAAVKGKGIVVFSACSHAGVLTQSLRATRG
jgi:7,8-dihydropterin-6-yl-methyl-4-(beta-D-ribofuranosyl)aminobenzene 5'-phosphate synthase